MANPSPSYGSGPKPPTGPPDPDAPNPFGPDAPNTRDDEPPDPDPIPLADPPEPPRTIDLLLDGLATRVTDGYPAAAPKLRRVVDAFLRDDFRVPEDLRWFGLVSQIAADLWDDEASHAVVRRQVELARETGALHVLAYALAYRAGVHIQAGEFAAAALLTEEADTLTQLTGSAPLSHTQAVLAAWRGDEARAVQMVEGTIRDGTARGEGPALTSAAFAVDMPPP